MVATGVLTRMAGANGNGQRVLLWALGIFASLASLVLAGVFGYLASRLDGHVGLAGHPTVIERARVNTAELDRVRGEFAALREDNAKEHREIMRSLDRVEDKLDTLEGAPD